MKVTLDPSFGNGLLKWALAGRQASGDVNGIKTSDSNTGRIAAGAGQAAGGASRQVQLEMQGPGKGLKTIMNPQKVSNELTFGQSKAPLSGEQVADLGSKHIRMITASVTGAGLRFSGLS